ncbi:MAG: ECF transporter S component [Clostridia bacterium]|nr:ECF transporter S component [Clostridia bacterium]
MKTKTQNTKITEKDPTRERLKYIAKVAVLSAMAMLISKLEIPLWFAPSFYKLDLSSVFVLTGSFALGPVAGIIISVMKNLLKLAIFGTQTSFVGELADVVVLILMSTPAALIYKKKKTLSGAVAGMSVGIVAMTVGACLFNYFVLIPFFASLFHMKVDDIVGMGTALNPHVTSLRSLIVFITAPFNLFKGIVCSAVTFLLYKRVSKILHI